MTMKLNKLILSLVFVIAIAAIPALAQGNSFSDPIVEYTFQLPDPVWKMNVKPSTTSPNVEYVYGDRADGHFEIRKLTVARDAIMTDVIATEENRLKFRQGYVAGKEENFAGRFRGTVFNFEYVAGGKNMGGRFYFLKTNDTTVYMLRFTGPKDGLRQIRNQTDSIARTFAVK
ncbi:MAG: hypothetical protein KBF83_03950 [Pyrinomonadaceae bacterium]|nr:hypothetical protein [Pyrinomonadaceae bacterium]